MGDGATSQPVFVGPTGTAGPPYSTVAVSVTPNPVNESALISCGDLAGKEYVVRIASSMGAVVRTYEGVGTEGVQFNKGDLGPGVYFVSVLVDDHGLGVTPLVIY
jgi:hypothetical protein